MTVNKKSQLVTSPRDFIYWYPSLRYQYGTIIRYRSSTSHSGVFWYWWPIKMSPTCRKMSLSHQHNDVTNITITNLRYNRFYKWNMFDMQFIALKLDLAIWIFWITNYFFDDVIPGQDDLTEDSENKFHTRNFRFWLRHRKGPELTVLRPSLNFKIIWISDAIVVTWQNPLPHWRRFMVPPVILLFPVILQNSRTNTRGQTLDPVKFMKEVITWSIFMPIHFWFIRISLRN